MFIQLQKVSSSNLQGFPFVPHSVQEDFLEVNDALGLFTGVAVWDNNFVYLLKMSSWILDLWYRYTSSLQFHILWNILVDNGPKQST